VHPINSTLVATDRKNRLESKKYLKVLKQEMKAEHARLNALEGVNATLTDEELLNALGVL
jgi:hypothetical protein